MKKDNEEIKEYSKKISAIRFFEIIGASFATLFAFCYIINPFIANETVATVFGTFGMWSGICTILSMSAILGTRLSNFISKKDQKREMKLEMFDEIFKDLKKENLKSQDLKIEEKQTVQINSNLVKETAKRWEKINKILNKKTKKYEPINAERAADQVSNSYFD